MTRRCSHCSNNGHNSRTCPTRAGGVRLFGVRLTDGVGSMKKSASMGSLYSAGASSTAGGGGGGGGGCSPNPGSPSNDPLRDHQAAADGYASDDAAHASCSSNCRNERKKGVPWTEEEHRMFLLGLQKLGKGDWRGIARNFVVSRTPTQVASHAQKYFIRQTNASRRKRRSSLFDMVPEMPMDQPPVLEERFMHQSPPNEPDNTYQRPALNLCQNQEPELAEPLTKNSTPPELNETIAYGDTLMPAVPAFYPAFIPVPYAFWPPDLTAPAKPVMGEMHEIVKPTPVVPKEPVNMDEVAGMSKLSIGEHVAGRMEPSALSLKLLGASASRQSAFHLNPSVSGPDLSQGSSNAIHAV